MDTGVDGMALSSVSNPKAASKKSSDGPDFGSGPMGAIAGGYDDRLDEVIVSLVSLTARALGG